VWGEGMGMGRKWVGGGGWVLGWRESAEGSTLHAHGSISKSAPISRSALSSTTMHLIHGLSYGYRDGNGPELSSVEILRGLHASRVPTRLFFFLARLKINLRSQEHYVSTQGVPVICRLHAHSHSMVVIAVQGCAALLPVRDVYACGPNSDSRVIRLCSTMPRFLCICPQARSSSSGALREACPARREPPPRCRDNRIPDTGPWFGESAFRQGA